MKTKLLTFALFGILTLGLVACSNEEIVPSQEIQLQEKSSQPNSAPGLPLRG